jgi:hypothetical protein
VGDFLFILIKMLSFTVMSSNCMTVMSQEITQSIRTTPNKVEVTSSNPHPPLVWTCQQKKKKICMNSYTKIY